MRVVYSANHLLHDPERDVELGVALKHWEQPARAERIIEALRLDPAFDVQAPTEHGRAPIEAVHAPGLVGFVADAWRVWREAGLTQELIPDTFAHPALRDGMAAHLAEPITPIGRLGYWCFDTGTPIGPGTYAAARGAVDVALTAADLALGGERVAYGLCRPPGHHAAHAVYGGFCYFNNAAIVADYLARQTGARAAVLDVDYHHGNGTQQIFYRRADVLYVSLHADPARAYPFFAGHADETGAGPGQGTTLNIPLPSGTTNDAYLDALERGLEQLARFAPAVTVVSLGLDTYALDPFSDLAITTEAYYECGRRVAGVCRRLVVLQEGGYYLPQLGENVRQWLIGAATQ